MNYEKLDLPENFFREEVRDGYTVSAFMKKVWAVELDLLREFARVCEKNDLRWFADGGTILGAVRHKGFIPWDDDVDVIMPRKDYDRLWEIAANEFKHPYFFQTTLSETGFFRTHAQLRNSDTTGFIDVDGTKPQINKGIFLDIFVLDNIPDNAFQKCLLKWRVRFHKAVLSYEYDRDYEKLSKKSKVFYRLVHLYYHIVDFKKDFERFNHRLLGRYQDKKTACAGDITLKWRESVIWDAAWWGDFVPMAFETLTLRVPVGYDAILTKQYGDYRKFPEDVTAMNGKSHGGVTFDPDTPYNKYLEGKTV